MSLKLTTSLFVLVQSVVYIVFIVFFQNILGLYVLFIIISSCMYASYIFRQIEVLKHQKDEQSVHLLSIQKEIKVRSNQMSLLLESIPNPLCFIDQRGVITIKNESFVRFIGQRFDELDLQDPSISPEIRQILKQVYNQEDYNTTERIIGTVTYQVSHTPIVANYRYYGALIIFQDVTPFLEGERMQQRFIADASHELKTPIAAIKGMSEILLREGFDDEDTEREFLIQIQKENKRLELLVNDLIAMSRLSSGKMILEKTNINFRDLVQACVRSANQQLVEHDLTVQIEGDPRLTLYCDAPKMTQILQNLLNNAISHTLSGTIAISYQETSKFFEIIVEDTGSGIAEDDIPHIFERFYRGSFSRNRLSGGSGLGLSIVKNLVEAHQGSIKVESELNKGTRFIIKLTQS